MFSVSCGCACGRRLGVGVFILALAAAFAVSARAADKAGETSRRVLALYNSLSPSDSLPHQTKVHEQLEMTLNHLGLFVDYTDINQPLPDFTPYRGIIVWFDTYTMREPGRVLPWLIRAMRAGVRIVMPSGFDEPHNLAGEPAGEGRLPEFWREFGLEPGQKRFSDVVPLVPRNLRPEMFSFETNVESLVGRLPVMRIARPGLEAWQVAEQPGEPGTSAPAVVVGDRGAWAINEKALYYAVTLENSEYRLAWNVDPFEFFAKALDCEGLPRPDVTTFWGTRGAYAHVDVDGPYNMTQDHREPPRYAFEVIYEHVLKAYPFPVTLGLIACEYDPALDPRFLVPGDTVAQALARPRPAWMGRHADIANAMRAIADKAFALPNVQAGCHGYSHPLVWREKVPAYAIPGYEFSYEQEVFGAVDYLNKNVLPKDKPVELFQWTGDCDPPEEPLAILDRMGLANINGGDPRYDGKYSSIYYICALTSPVGKYLQVYTSGANENIYTNGWTGYKGAFNNVIATFERADSPRRLLPVNIYYHVFPAERQAGLAAILNAYDWAADRDLCWMRAAEYVDAIKGFASTRIGKTPDGGWWLEDYGTCPSLRFDGEPRRVDMAKSRNVAGYAHHNGALYVSLTPGGRAEIRLTDSPPAAPCLAGSSGMLRNIVAGEREWRAEARIWGPGFIEIWAPGGEWRGTLTRPGGDREERPVSRLSDGRVRMELPDSEGQWLEVSLEL